MDTPGYREALRRIAEMGPDGVLELDKLGLTVLPPLPDTVRELYCEKNKLTQLPDLPTQLEILDCGQNKLTSLPPLPSNLHALYFAYNQVTRIPRLPDSLTIFDGKFNSFAEPFYLYHTRFSGSQDINRLRKDVNTYLDTFSKGRNVAALKSVAKSPQDTLASNVLTHPLYSGLVGQYMSGKENLDLKNQMAALKRNAGRGGSRRKTRKVRKGRKSRKSRR